MKNQILRKRKESGKMGGDSTFEKHGVEHFRKMALARKEKYGSFRPIKKVDKSIAE